jgi:hypothetical protein
MKKPEERFCTLGRIQEMTTELVKTVVEKARYRTEALAALRAAQDIVETFPDSGEVRLTE